jgi:hydroxymethylglutaryl-CoA synthase
MKKIALISTFCDNEEKLEILKENIKKLKSLFVDVIIFTPLKLTDEIIALCDYVIFSKENPELLTKQIGETEKDKLKALTKSPEYLELINQKIYPSEIASGQVGNIYTGSIFLGLLSTLSYHVQQNSTLTNQKVGFIAYGSGSKSKVFEASLSSEWKSQVEKISLFEHLGKCHEIDFETYEKLHKKELKQSVLKPKKEFVLDYIENENPVLIGARYYKFMD